MPVYDELDLEMCTLLPQGVLYRRGRTVWYSYHKHSRLTLTLVGPSCECERLHGQCYDTRAANVYMAEMRVVSHNGPKEGGSGEYFSVLFTRSFC